MAGGYEIDWNGTGAMVQAIGSVGAIRRRSADHEAEDADDVAVYNARKAELAAGGDVLPPEVSAAILRGESRLKAIRTWRGETQLHLSSITGIGQGYLSDLENGRRSGTAETIAKLGCVGGVAFVGRAYASAK